MRSSKPLRTFLLTLVLALSPLAARGAYAVVDDLMIFPTRIVLEDGQKAAQVDLINSGTEAISFRISLERKRMNELGEFRPVRDKGAPGELFADQIVRYSPRQVTLAPGGGQTVRIVLKLPDNLPPGEYRSHLSFSRVPAASTLPPAQEGDENRPGGIQTRLMAYVGASIPVIVRHGKLDAKLSIEEVALRPGNAGEAPQVDFVLHREGTRSVYGDITVVAIDGDGREEQIGAASGVAVYTPNRVRRAHLTLRPKVKVPQGGQLKVIFTERGEKKPLAESTVPPR